MFKCLLIFSLFFVYNPLINAAPISTCVEWRTASRSHGLHDETDCQMIQDKINGIDSVYPPVRYGPKYGYAFLAGLEGDEQYCYSLLTPDALMLYAIGGQMSGYAPQIARTCFGTFLYV